MTAHLMPDAALLWARGQAAASCPIRSYRPFILNGHDDHLEPVKARAEAFRAGQAHERRADAGLLTNGQIGDEHFTPTADIARRIASYCEGDARKNVYKAALQELTAHERRVDAGLLAALEATREMLGLAEQALCDAICPAQWKTGEESPHCDLHRDIIACLAKYEPVRDAARAAIAAAKGHDHAE